MQPEPKPFRVDLVPERERVRVRPVGEMDIATCPEVGEQLETVLSSGFRHLVLDLREVDFLDSTGLRLVMEWARRSDADGFRFEVTPGTAPVRRAFEISGLLDRLPFASS